MTRKSQILLSVIALGVFDAVIPFFPILAFISIYVLLARPLWFLDWVREVYESK